MHVTLFLAVVLRQQVPRISYRLGTLWCHGSEGQVSTSKEVANIHHQTLQNMYFSTPIEGGGDLRLPQYPPALIRAWHAGFRRGPSNHIPCSIIPSILNLLRHVRAQIDPWKKHTLNYFHYNNKGGSTLKVHGPMGSTVVVPCPCARSTPCMYLLRL